MKKLTTKVTHRLLGLLLFGLMSMTAFAQSITVTGFVSDNEGPAPGVTVQEKGTTNATMTDIDGKYSITVSNSSKEIMFTSIGYLAQTIKVGTKTTIDVKLELDAKELDAVVAIGYGSAKRRDLTGSISSVESGAINSQAVQNVAQAIQGKVAGVQITNDGRPGSSPKVNIRGMGSVAEEAKILYVVDDVMMDDISFLGPNDIENVTILKDASSCAIYGVRASNGVIIVKTKRGAVSSKPRISFDTYLGYKTPERIVQMANGQEYVQLYNEKMDINGTPGSKLDPSKYTDNHNYYDDLIRNTVTNSQNLTISGGSETVRYSVGLNHLNDNGLFVDDDYRRFGFNTKLDFTLSKRARAGFTSIISQTKTKPQELYNLFKAFHAVPALAAKDSKGEWNTYANTPFDKDVNVTAKQHYEKNIYQNKFESVLSGYFEFDLMEGLSYRTTLSVSPMNLSYFRYWPSYEVNSNTKNSDNAMQKKKQDGYKMQYDNMLTYNKTFAKNHNLKAMFGTSYTNEKNTTLTIDAKGFKNLPEMRDSYFSFAMPRIRGKESVTYPNDKGYFNSEMSYFGRISYDYMGRYLLNLSLRNDHSKKFPKHNRSGWFPAIGTGWVVSEEGFWNKVTIDFLKIRASWGEKGNANIPANIYEELIDDSYYTSLIFGPGQNTGEGTISSMSTIKVLPNPNLRWETTREFNAGIDLTLLKERMSVSVDYYHRSVIDAIFPISGLTQSGLNTGGTWGNNANLYNRGVELSIGWNDKVSDFSYGLNANLTYNQNKVTKLSIESAGGAYGKFFDLNPTMTLSTVGRPLAEFYGLQAIGVYQDQDQIDKTPHLSTAKPGDLIFADLTNDGLIDGRDRTTLGNPNPPFFFGFNANFEYKGFDFNISLQGVAGNKIVNAVSMWRFGNENYTKDMAKNRWHGTGTSNTHPSAMLTDAQTMSSYYVEDGSYLRIKNIQAGYTLPNNLLQRFGISRTRFYFNCENLHTFTKYSGFTPEIATSGVMSGLDKETYPLSTLYSIGLNLNF